jgi:branched-chain amino acid transport system permease protein
LVKAGVFAVGSLLATTAGVLGGPVYGARPGLDASVLILALVVVVIGGLGSVRGRWPGR